jgi:hypothetical protein
MLYDKMVKGRFLLGEVEGEDVFVAEPHTCPTTLASASAGVVLRAASRMASRSAAVGWSPCCRAVQKAYGDGGNLVRQTIPAFVASQFVV